MAPKAQFLKRMAIFLKRMPLPGTGGVAAHQENVAKPPLKAQTGWLFWTDHPVRAFQRLPSAISLDGTATPPVPGGDYAPLDSNSFTPSMTADNPATCEILGGHSLRLRAVALALRGPPLQLMLPTLCAKPVCSVDNAGNRYGSDRPPATGSPCTRS